MQNDGFDFEKTKKRSSNDFDFDKTKKRTDSSDDELPRKDRKDTKFSFDRENDQVPLVFISVTRVKTSRTGHSVSVATNRPSYFPLPSSSSSWQDGDERRIERVEERVHGTRPGSAARSRSALTFDDDDKDLRRSKKAPPHL